MNTLQTNNNYTEIIQPYYYNSTYLIEFNLNVIWVIIINK